MPSASTTPLANGGWLDSLLAPGYSSVAIAGVPLPQEQILNLKSGATAVDNPGTGSTDVTITGGAVSAAPQELAYSSSAQQIVIATPGVEQSVVVDCSGGSPVLLMPTGAVNGQVLRIGDTRPSGASTSYTWGAGKVPILSVGTGVYIADPDNLGTFVLGATVSPPPIAGDDIVYMWLTSKNAWILQ